MHYETSMRKSLNSCQCAQGTHDDCSYIVDFCCVSCSSKLMIFLGWSISMPSDVEIQVLLLSAKLASYALQVYQSTMFRRVLGFTPHHRQIKISLFARAMFKASDLSMWPGGPVQCEVKQLDFRCWSTTQQLKLLGKAVY